MYYYLVERIPTGRGSLNIFFISLEYSTNAPISINDALRKRGTVPENKGLSCFINGSIATILTTFLVFAVNNIFSRIKKVKPVVVIISIV